MTREAREHAWLYMGLRLRKEVVDRLGEIARKRETAKSVLIREAVREWLARQEE